MLAFSSAACVVLPLAANDWLEGLVPLLFFLFWIVSQVVGVVQRLGGAKGANPGAPEPVKPIAPPRDVVRETRPPVIPPAAGADPRDARDELNRQIEAFRRAQVEAADRGAPRRDPKLPPERPKSPPPRREPVATKPSPPAAPRGVDPAGRRSPPTIGKPTATPPLPAVPPAAILGGHSGEIGRHVDGAFAHDLAHGGGHPGSSDQSAVAPQTVPKVAHELVAMFRSPETIRQVILLREVLDRPIDRW